MRAGDRYRSATRENWPQAGRAPRARGERAMLRIAGAIRARKTDPSPPKNLRHQPPHPRHNGCRIDSALFPELLHRAVLHKPVRQPQANHPQPIGQKSTIRQVFQHRTPRPAGNHPILDRQHIPIAPPGNPIQELRIQRLDEPQIVVSHRNPLSGQRLDRLAGLRPDGSDRKNRNPRLIRRRFDQRPPPPHLDLLKRSLQQPLRLKSTAPRIANHPHPPPLRLPGGPSRGRVHHRAKLRRIHRRSDRQVRNPPQQR